MQVVVGRVAKAHGITGELSIDVRTDSPNQRFSVGYALKAKLASGGFRELTVAAVRGNNGRLLVRFAQVKDRDDAESLHSALLLADTSDLVPIDDPDEFYDHELEGLRVELTDGTEIGEVEEVLHSPAGELLSIKHDGRSVLVPFVRDIVPTIDVKGGRVVLDPPEGLLD